MESKNVWIWALGGISVLAISTGIFLITLPKTSQTHTPPPTSSSATAAPTTSTTTPASSEKAPFVITTMTHMEGNFTDDKNQKVFEKHIADMRWAMDLFDEYGAKLTFESEQPFAKANTVWGTNILKEAIDNGHGVGTHADFGAGSGTALTLSELTADFKENKALVDGLVGAENNQGVSGGTGPTDWVLAAQAAGFKYIDAVTGFAYLSMPMSVRPEGWNDNYIRHVTYHDSVPLNLLDRIYPMPLKDAKDLVADPGASFTMMSGDIGELASIAEGRITCNPDCTLDQADVDAVIAAIDEANAQRDTSRFAKINMHIPLALLNSKNETILRSLLSAIKTYTDKGELSWDTQLGAYKQYTSWGK